MKKNSGQRTKDLVKLFSGEVISAKDMFKEEILSHSPTLPETEEELMLPKVNSLKEAIRFLENKEQYKREVNMEDYKAQLSIKAGKRDSYEVMLNVRDDTDDKVKARAKEWLDEMKAYVHEMADMVKEIKANGDEPQEEKGEFPVPECCKCGGEMYDNRGTDFMKKHPKSPQFKCKDKECGKAAWLKGGKLSWSD